MQKKLLGDMGAAVLLLAGTMFAQTPAARPEFEVASIKPAPPLVPMAIAAGKIHIGVSIDAQRVDIGNLSLADLICRDYTVKPHQLVGPDWMKTQRFDVLAKIPEGASRDQVPEMLQSLLAERFKLSLHRDTKEQSVYALLVGKNGPKLKESEPDAESATASGAVPSDPGGKAGGPGENMSFRRSSDGKGVAIQGGQTGPMKVSMGEGGMMHMEFAKMTMSALSDVLTRFLDRPVVDMTGLKGNYQVALDLSMEEMRNVVRASGLGGGLMMAAPGAAVAGRDAGRAPADAASTPSGGSIFTTVQQLGLKLDARKSAVETIVVDHLEKTPTEN